MSIANTLSNLKVRTKVYAGVGTLLLLAVGIAASGIYGLREVNGEVDQLQVLSANTQSALHARVDLEVMRRSQLRYRFDGDKAILATFNAARDDAATRLDGLTKVAATEARRILYAAARAKLVELDTAMPEFIRVSDAAAEHRAKLRTAGDDLVAISKSAVEAALRSDSAGAAGAAHDMDGAVHLIRATTWRNIVIQEAAAAAIIKSAADRAQTAIVILDMSGDPALSQLLPRLRAALDTYLAAETAHTVAVATLDGIFNTRMRVLIQSALDNLAEATTQLQAAYREHNDRVDVLGDRTMWIQEMLAGVAVVLGLLMAFALAQGIAGPVIGMTRTMRRLADGDLETDLPAIGRKDEIGDMAQAVLVFRTNATEARRLTAEQATAQAARQVRTDRIEALVSDFQSKAGQMMDVLAASSTELQATAQAMTGIAGRTTEQTSTVAAAAEEASINVGTVATAAEELASSITEISRQVSQSAQIAGRAQDDARRTDAIVRALAESSGKIGAVVSLISNIAGQTNLLALNATIEAARAGDAGKGFAVVASEVKSLASQTARATDEIAQQIGQVQSATREAVTAIGGIASTIDEINRIASTIAAAVEEQGSATQEIARNVQQVADGTQDVSRTIIDVSQGAQETGAAATQVLGAANELSHQSENLKSRIDHFIGEVRAA